MTCTFIMMNNVLSKLWNDRVAGLQGLHCHTQIQYIFSGNYIIYGYFGVSRIRFRFTPFFYFTKGELYEIIVFDR